MTNPLSKEDIGKVLRTLRQGLGLTKEAMAQKIEVTPRTILNWEGGKTYLSREGIEQVLKLFDSPSEKVDFLVKIFLTRKDQAIRSQYSRTNVYDLLRGILIAVECLGVPKRSKVSGRVDHYRALRLIQKYLTEFSEDRLYKDLQASAPELIHHFGFPKPEEHTSSD